MYCICVLGWHSTLDVKIKLILQFANVYNISLLVHLSSDIQATFQDHRLDKVFFKTFIGLNAHFIYIVIELFQFDISSFSDIHCEMFTS